MTDFKVMFKCNCGCGVMEIERWLPDDDETIEPEYMVHYYIPAFYAKQRHSLLSTVIERIKQMWNIARGREFFLFDICANQSEMEAFSKGLQETITR